MNQFAESARLAWRDWKFEYLISVCSVIALASMLAPLLSLIGLKNGVVDGLRARLLEDPAVLIITPKSDAGRYTREDIEKLGKLPGARYAVGRTRDTSTDLTLINPSTRKRVSVSFEPAGPGEPILERYGASPPANTVEPEIVLSASAARALGAAPGDVLSASLGRRSPSGRLESADVKFKTIGVLPVEAGDRRVAFASLHFLEEMENYRDYIETPSRNWPGRPAAGERQYSSFRLYAASLDAAESLASELEREKIEVLTKAREIASIKALEEAINQVILIIALAVAAGAAAFAVSSALGSVNRKKRMLGMLRLLGFRQTALLCYPLAQTLFTTLAGFALALVLYFCVSLGIAWSFADRGLGCKLGATDALICLGAVALLSLAACLKPALTAARVEPSVALREV